MAATKTKKPKKQKYVYVVKRFSYRIGKPHCRTLVAFLHVKVSPETGTVHMAHGLRYWKQIIHTGKRFTGGKWRNES